ncbi:hypothetical protein [Chitinophaga qingshengii]|uniref:Uncharacterized protein n=1 Tax=Chitinophaga qingshengii TaxID=1569794 RepID=A0ABR7TI29_9BACT|nr:hypothetical protein [Chitinophaga qingshengii]MBC9930173.1 hypothetical protein [Chitinophaga qingshengii]
MSNIVTAYLRIRKTNNTHLSEGEQENLFRHLVNYHGEFGSYWVRVLKKYRQNLKCLDIQYGCGKTWYEDASEYITDNSEVEVVTRKCNEGGLDTIELTRFKDGKETYEIRERLCTYAFDKIMIFSDTNWLAEEGADKDTHYSAILDVAGTYHSANDKSFVDVWRDGTPLYEEEYPYDYFVLTETDNFKFTAPAFLVELQENNFSRMPNHSKMILYYKRRKVALLMKNYDKIEVSTADYWDNCADETCQDW